LNLNCFGRLVILGANDRYGLMGSAYLNNNRDELVIVFVNMGENTEPIKLNITGLSLTSLTPYVTTDNVADNLKAYDSFNVDDIFEIPARSVVTLVAELQNTNIKSSRTQFPLKYKLFQNCPNPFTQAWRCSTCHL
jgi:hypothetical protein